MNFFHFACLILLQGDPVLADPPAVPVKLRSPWNADPPVDAKNPEAWNFSARQTSGYVESVGKDWITLYWPARKILRLRNDPLSGELLELKEESHAAIPGKRFMLGKELADGGHSKNPLVNYSFPIADVRVGDRVSIFFDRRNGVDICQTIGIAHRAGGIVPPPSGSELDDDELKDYYDRQRAWQNWEQHRLPFPPKFRPTYLRNDGKVCFGPYPAESTEIIPVPTAVAPAPRLGKP